MPRKTSFKFSEEMAKKAGFLPAPPDHPIYSEGYHVTLSRPSHERLASKASGTPTTGSQSDSGSRTRTQK